MATAWLWGSDTIELLLKHGSDVGDRDRRGRSCLHLALQQLPFCKIGEWSGALSKLLRAGADVYAKDSRGVTPSHIACNRNLTCSLSSLELSDEENDDLQLRKVWVQALTMCDYDAEEVIRTSVGDEIAKYGWYGSESSWIDENGIPHDEKD